MEMNFNKSGDTELLGYPILNDALLDCWKECLALSEFTKRRDEVDHFNKFVVFDEFRFVWIRTNHISSELILSHWGGETNALRINLIANLFQVIQKHKTRNRHGCYSDGFNTLWRIRTGKIESEGLVVGVGDRSLSWYPVMHFSYQKSPTSMLITWI